MIQMSYDPQTAGVKISFILREGAESLITGTEGFEQQTARGDRSVCPQTALNLRHMSFMLAAMAVAQAKEDTVDRCEQCARRIYKLGDHWKHTDGDYRHPCVPRKKVFIEV